MKNLLKWLFFSGSLLWIVSCGSSRKLPTSSADYEMVEVTASNQHFHFFNAVLEPQEISPHVQVVRDDSSRQNLLFALNQQQKNIAVFDLKGKGLLKTIPLEALGEHPAVNSFFVHNLDSIFVNTRYSNKVVLMDISGVPQNSFDIELKDERGDQVIVTSDHHARIFYQDGALFLRWLPSRIIRQQQDFPEQIYVKITADTQMMLAQSPEHLALQNGYYRNLNNLLGNQTLGLTALNVHQKLIYTSFFEPQIYAFESVDSIVDIHHLPSKFIDSIPQDAPLEDAEEATTNLAHYGSFFYDSFRDLYYRIALPKTAEEDAAQYFYLMVISSDWRILNEIPLDAQYYHPQVLIPTPDGILLAKKPFLDANFWQGNIRYFELLKLTIE